MQEEQRTEHEDLEDEQTHAHAVVGERPRLTAALVRPICVKGTSIPVRLDDECDAQNTKRKRYL